MSRQPKRALSELEIVQNPALGAISLWQFGLGFQEQDETPAPFPLAFLVLPLLLHKPTLELIRSTKKGSGLALFAGKLGVSREELLAVHERALILRELTLQSLSVGLTTSLLTVGYADATLRSHPLEGKAPPMPERLKEIPKAANKIGAWFSRVDLEQVALTLKVAF